LVDGIELKIWKSRVHSNSGNKGPGSIQKDGKSLIVHAQKGEIELLEVQMAGKKRMTARDFVNGYTFKNWSAT
jgi:methionyl-tRNA formyltransferase